MKYFLIIFALVSPVFAGEITKEEYRQAYEDKIQEVAELRHKLFQIDTRVTVGSTRYDQMAKDLIQARLELSAANKQLQSARSYLETKGLHLSDITGKIYNTNEGPLHLEKLARRKVEEKLKQEQAERAEETAVRDRKVAELNLQLYTLSQETEKYKKQVEEDRRYFQSLKKENP